MAFRARFEAAILVVLLAALAAAPVSAAQRVVLFEQFTNWGCAPCASAAPVIHQIMVNYGNQVAAVKYHVWWPNGADPWYLHNPGPVQVRDGYYNISGVPDVCIDAVNGPDPHTYNSMATYINNRLAVPSPIAISGTGLIQGPNMNISFDVDVETPQVGSNFRLFVMVTEEDIYGDRIPNPGGQNPNGETHNYDVFRRENNANGEPIDLSVAGVQHFDRTLPYHSSYNLLDLHVVVWVQDVTAPHGFDYEVLQAAEFPLLVPYHFSFRHTSTPVQIAGANDVVNFTSEIENDGANPDTYDITVSGVPTGWAYSYTTPAGTFSGPSTLALGSSEMGAISLDLDSQGNPGPATVEMTIASQADPQGVSSLEFKKLNGLDVLLVDDDGGDTRETHYAQGLDAAGVSWGHWDVEAWGDLTAQDLVAAATHVIWSTGITGGIGSLEPSFSPTERATLDGFLASGGSALVSGPEIGYDLCDPASPRHTPEAQTWFEQTFHATYSVNYHLSRYISGTAGDPIGDGLSGVLLSATVFIMGGLDGVQAGPGGTVVFSYDGQPHKAGIRYDGGSSKVVYFAFGLENVDAAATRNLIIQRVIDWFGVTTGIPAPSEAPSVTRLFQNYPNPFKPETAIAYSVSDPGFVQLRVYDLNGRMVRELVNEVKTAARHEVSWDGRDDFGRELKSGVYFYQLTAPGVQQTKRMVLAK